MKKSIICLLLSILMLGFVFQGKMTIAFAKDNDVTLSKITAKSALLIDHASGEVIYEKNSNDRLPIASMTKLATLSIVFDSISKGLIKENDMVVVSENAASVGGSSAFLDAGSSYKVVDLIKTVIISSANDSSVALAEFVAGSEDVFVSKMNKLAKSMNLEDTNFANCTGLPADNHYSSAHDIAKIYMSICDNSIYQKYAKVWMDDFVHPSGRKTELVNTNRLVKTFDGIEGGKTGYTDSAKFCLTASAKRGGMRLVGVVIGVSDSKTRFAEMSKMFSFGFANYQSKNIVNKDVAVTIFNFKNSKQAVEIYPEKSYSKFMSKTDDAVFTTDFQINELKAPITAGNKVGKLFVFDKNNMVIEEIDLIVNEDVNEVGFKESLRKMINAW